MFAAKLLERSEKGTNSRQRSLPPQVTFWAFVAQALSPKSSCREVVRRVGGVVALGATPFGHLPHRQRLRAGPAAA